MLGGGSSGSAPNAAGRVVLGQLQLAVAVRGPHHRDVASDAVESDGAVREEAFDRRLAFQLHAEFGEERDSGVQVVDDDGDVVHPLNSHVSSTYRFRLRLRRRRLPPSRRVQSLFLLSHPARPIARRR